MVDRFSFGVHDQQKTINTKQLTFYEEKNNEKSNLVIDRFVRGIWLERLQLQRTYGETAER